MDKETLATMDIRADELIKSMAPDPSCNEIDIVNYAIKVGKGLNEIYNLPVDSAQLRAYVGRGVGWALEHKSDSLFCIKLAYMFKKVLHDCANGEEAPSLEDFDIMLQAESKTRLTLYLNQSPHVNNAKPNSLSFSDSP